MLLSVLAQRVNVDLCTEFVKDPNYFGSNQYFQGHIVLFQLLHLCSLG